MLAVPAMTAWIEGIFFDNLEMPSDFFGDCGGIFIYFLGDLFEGHTVPESRFDDDALTKRQMCILCHNVLLKAPPLGRTLYNRKEQHPATLLSVHST